MDEPKPVKSVRVDNTELHPGDQVRLRPLGRADIFDIALNGKVATIVTIEQDFEDRIHVSVTVDDDPGSDLGLRGQPGHRFYFGIDEIEPLASAGILIACIGNIFLGDDAFGVEVARALAGRSLPKNVSVVDFGIRGWDLTYALMEKHEAVILVDAAPRGEPPGTIYLIEPEVDSPADGAAFASDDLLVDGHDLDPAKVLRLAKTLDAKQNRILLVGCEPSPIDPDQEMEMALSAPVQAAIPEAVAMIESLLVELCAAKHLVERS